MGYRYSKKVSRMEPLTEFKDGEYHVSVGYKYKKRDPDVVPSTDSGAIDQLEVDLKIPPTENLLPSSFSADTVFGSLVSVNGKVVKASEANNISAPAFASLTALSRSIAIAQWDKVGEPNQFRVTSLGSRVSYLPVDALSFRLPVAPIKAESVQILATLAEESGGEALTLKFDKQGLIDSPYARGFIDYQTGLVSLRFVKRVDLTGTSKGYKLANGSSSSSSNTGGSNGSTSSTQYSYNRTYEYWGVEHEGDLYKGTETEVEIGGNRIYGYEPLMALADSIKYNAVGYTFLPLDKDILGVDTVKLPPSGKVPAYRQGDLILIKAQKEYVFSEVQPNTPYPLGKTRLSLIDVVDSLGVKISYDDYVVDLDAGVVTFTELFDSSLYLAPFKALYHYQDMAVATDVSISGDIKLAKQLTHDFDAEDTLVSSAMLMGTLQSRVYNMFTQDVWKNKFLDYRDGEDSIFKFDTAVAPIEVTNESCIQEDWALVLTGSTSFDLIGKNVGKIASGSTLEDFTPLNPVTKKPLMVLRAAGFSAGGRAGNVLRFKTQAANYPIWAVRTVLQSNATTIDHSFSLEFKGNKDRVL